MFGDARRAEGRIVFSWTLLSESGRFGPILADGIIHHDWIVDVLEDLRSYALQNGLPATAAQAEEALRVVRAELAAGDGPLGAISMTPCTGRRN
jgi:hypothetical protein